MEHTHTHVSHTCVPLNHLAAHLKLTQCLYQLYFNKTSFKMKEVSPLYFLGTANLCHESNALKHQQSCHFWIIVIQTPPYSPILKFRVRLTNGSTSFEEPDSLCKPSSSLPFFKPDPRDLLVHLSTCHLSVNTGTLCRF